MHRHTRRLTLLVAIATIFGCRAAIDEESVATDFHNQNARYAAFRDRFPDLESTVTEYQPPRTVPVNRRCMLRSRAALPGGYFLLFRQQVEVDSEGKLCADAYQPSPLLRIESPAGQIAELTSREFDELLATDDINAALADIGVDFSLTDVNERALIELLRESVPAVERMLRELPDASARLHGIEPYRSQGRVVVFAPIGSRLSLDGTWRFRLGPGGKTVEAELAAEYELWAPDGNSAANQLAEPSAEGRSIPLTIDEFEALLASDGREQTAATFWTQRDQ